MFLGPSLPHRVICIVYLQCISYNAWLTRVCLSYLPALLYSHERAHTVSLSWCWPTSYSLFITRIVLCSLALVLGGVCAR